MWRECDGAAHVLRPVPFRAFRVVESQQVVATRKLVDTLAEHDALEALLESAKPPLPTSRSQPPLHYLLSTPFRYPPLRHGSRVGDRLERGIWYGSTLRRTALAERAYYRLLFVHGTTADLGPLTSDDTVFQAAIGATRLADLTLPPFAAFTHRISSPASYADSQPLGTAMRAAGVEACLFSSARDPERAVNCALFEPVFASALPFAPETWTCRTERSGVEFRNPFLGMTLVFSQGDFLVEGVLPRPGI